MEFTKEETLYFLRGSILGDMCIEKRKAIINTQSITHKDYTDLKYQIFSKYFNTGKIGETKNWGSNPDENLRKANRFRIYDIELSNQIHKEMYDKNGKRKIPDISYLNEYSLFFWYLDDGSLISKVNKRNGYAINDLRIGLKSFADENILNFIKQFKEKYGIEFHAEKPKNVGKITRIFISSKRDIVKFLQLLYKFYNIIPESLKYKFQPVFTDKEFKEKYDYLILK